MTYRNLWAKTASEAVLPTQSRIRDIFTIPILPSSCHPVFPFHRPGDRIEKERPDPPPTLIAKPQNP